MPGDAGDRRAREVTADARPLDRIEVAASLLGIPLNEARGYQRHARQSLPGATDEQLIEATIDLLRRDHSKSAINQARRSIGEIE